jgi:flagellar biogenesis protein FliO
MTVACLALIGEDVAAQQPEFAPARASHYAPVTAHPLPAAGYSNGVRPASTEDPVSANPPPLRLAPRTAASRQPLTRPAAPTVGGAVGTVAGGLGVVIGLFFVIAWLSRKFAPAGAVSLPKEAVELLGHAPFAGRQQLRLLRIGNKLLLIAVSPAGLETLTEITDAAEVEHLLALCRRNRPGSSQAAFQQVLGQLATEPEGSRPALAQRNTVRGAR